MEFVNSWVRSKTGLSKKDLKVLLKVLAPLAPFMAEELWFGLREKKSIHLEKWPEMKVVEKQRQEIVIQVNGKLRDTVEMGVEEATDKVKVLAVAKKREKVKKWLEGKEIKKEIFVPGRLVNFVV